MPVRFICYQCQQLLSVTRRKIGETVPCPTCGASVTVPEVTTADAEKLLATRRMRKVGKEDTAAAATEVEEESTSRLVTPLDAGFEVPPPPPVSGPPSAPPPRTTSGEPVFAVPRDTWPATTEPPRRTPSPPPTDLGDLVLVSRKMVYVQAVFLALVALLFFALGYVLGGSSTTAPLDSPAEEGQQAGDAVVVQVKLAAAAPDGAVMPDAGAVALALPADRQPQPKISVRGLRPRDAAADSVPGTEAIQALGGDYVRAGADGSLQFVVPRPGRYHLLLISAKGLRGGGESIDAAALEELAPYFDVPLDLIGANRYQLTTQQLDGSTPPILHAFAAPK